MGLRRVRRFLALQGVIALLCVAPVQAEESDEFRVVSVSAAGRLTGRLTNHHGQPIRSQRIELYDREAAGPDTHTDDAGWFVFEQVAPGEHLVIIDNWYVPCRVVATEGQASILELSVPRDDVGQGGSGVTQAGLVSVFTELPVQTASYSDRFGEPANLFPDGDPRTAAWPDDLPTTPESDFVPVQPRRAPEEMLEEIDSEPAAEDAAESDRQFDPALVSRGQAAFQRSCTDCHDANRALDKKKSYSAWLSTVRRMAAMDGANVASGDFEAIATYLASLNPSAGADADSAGGALDEALALGSLGDFSANATISPLWRTVDDSNTVQSPGFFVDAWLTASWNPEGLMRAKVTACTSCHSDSGFTFELVEASATIDLLRLYDEIHGDPCQGEDAADASVQVELRAGRFPMPFGGFQGYGHPGALRTLTNPLIYDMARRVDFLALPVMNMPFSDEGADLFLKAPITEEWNVTTDVYVMNGRSGTGFISSFLSRSYRDNNDEPAVGSRLTVGNSDLRAGTSIVWGDSGIGTEYVAWGGDINYTFEDLLRVYLEYACRNQDFGAASDEVNKGYVIELELYLTDDPAVSLLTRYDTLDSNAIGSWVNVRRFTWGVNTVLPGGSVLLLHHEHSDNNIDNGQPDLIGVRWTCTF